MLKKIRSSWKHIAWLFFLMLWNPKGVSALWIATSFTSPHKRYRISPFWRRPGQGSLEQLCSKEDAFRRHRTIVHTFCQWLKDWELNSSTWSGIGTQHLVLGCLRKWRVFIAVLSGYSAAWRREVATRHIAQVMLSAQFPSPSPSVPRPLSSVQVRIIRRAVCVGKVRALNPKGYWLQLEGSPVGGSRNGLE